MARAKQASSSSESGSEEQDSSPPPPRRRQTLPRRTNAGLPPGRLGLRHGSMPGTYPENDEDDNDNEEPKSPPRRAGWSRGGQPWPNQRRVASDDDGNEDIRSRPVAGNASADRGGRGGRAGGAGRLRPISTRVRSDDDTIDADTGSHGTSPPRRRASTVSSRRFSSEEVESAGPERRLPNAGRRPRSSPVTFSPIEPDSPTEDMDDELRRALAASQAESQPVRPSEDDDFEEQMRQVMEASKAEAAAQERRASRQLDEEEQLRRLMERSEKEHKAQERAKARREREEAQRQQEEFERVLQESQRAAQRSGHLKEENEFERAIRLSQVTHNADVRKAAERMADQRETAPLSPSWTEGRLQSGRHQGGSPSTSVPPSPTPTEQAPSTSSPKLRRGISQRIMSGLSGSKKVITKPRSSSVLAPIPETAAAGPSSAPPPANVSSSKAVIKTPSSSTALTTHQKARPAIPDADLPSSPTPATPFIPGKPPIKPDRLIAMCERAFPPDPAIAAAIRNSQRTASIETVQNSANEYDEQLAAVLAESAAHAQTHEDRPADITDVGLDDPPPEYHTSSRDRRIDARRWTTSDYRREQPGYKKAISPEIREIMRLYGELQAYLKCVEPPDPRGEKIEREKQERLLLLPSLPPGADTSSITVVPSRKGKEKATDDDATAVTTTPPPEIADSLDDMSRPRGRAEVGGTPSASARNYAANLPTAAARQRAMEEQKHSAAVSASRLPNSRPRRPKTWDPQVERFGRLSIMEEEDEAEEALGRAEERMSKGTAKRVRQDRSYRRSGI
ncbi:MAG: hypothetical protein LQ352_003946 [Teloschistes flavicans]|nr:MAG: hypothetical protein LQ352_003946 [Teloschistes flavicans]